MLNKQKKNVWIIGGSSGYGLEISKFFLARKFNVLVSGKKKKEEQSHLNDLDYLEYIQLDLEDEKSIKLACKYITKDLSLDLIIITSAISNKISKKKFPFLEDKLKTYMKFLKINSLGPVLIMKNIISNLVKNQKKIKVIFFSSKAGWSNLKGFGFYNTSKSLLHHLILNLSSEINNKYQDFTFSPYILEPGEANTRMNTESFNHPNKILPSIDFIIRDAYHKKTIFLDRDINYLKFCYKINEMYF